MNFRQTFCTKCDSSTALQHYIVLGYLTLLDIMRNFICIHSDFVSFSPCEKGS